MERISFMKLFFFGWSGCISLQVRQAACLTLSRMTTTTCLRLRRVLVSMVVKHCCPPVSEGTAPDKGLVSPDYHTWTTTCLLSSSTTCTTCCPPLGLLLLQVVKVSTTTREQALHTVVITVGLLLCTFRTGLWSARSRSTWTGSVMILVGRRWRWWISVGMATWRTSGSGSGRIRATGPPCRLVGRQWKWQGWQRCIVGVVREQDPLLRMYLQAELMSQQLPVSKTKTFAMVPSRTCVCL